MPKRRSRPRSETGPFFNSLLEAETDGELRPSGADASLERFIERDAGGEGLFERGYAGALGALGQKPAGELGRPVAGAVQRNEPMRIGLLAHRRHRIESLPGRFDDRTGRNRQPRPDFARLQRILASEEALISREVRARLAVPARSILAEARERFGAVPATGEDADPHGPLALHCARDKVADLAGWLLTKGAERVSVAALEQTFAARNALYDALEERIGAAQA